jgi:hypothetical protein
MKGLSVLLACWILYCLGLVFLSSITARPGVLIAEGALGGFGIATVSLALAGRLRWQPWVLLTAAGFLLFHGVLTSLAWFSEGIDWRAIQSMMDTRMKLPMLLFIKSGFLTAAGYVMEQIVMPGAQLLAAVVAVLLWGRKPA